MGIVRAICISEKKGTQKTETDKAYFRRNWGIDGDAHAGNWHRQVSLLSYDKIKEFQEKGADIGFGAFGENLVVEGYDFSKLPLGTRFRCGDVLLEMSQIGKLCHNHCQIYEKMGDCIMPREGVFAVVLEDGIIEKGDTIELIPANPYRTLTDRDENTNCIMATIIDGAHAGERQLWIDGILRYNSVEEGYLDSYSDEIISSPGNYIISIPVKQKPSEEEQTYQYKTNYTESNESRVFCERIGTRKKLVICGAGHVSMPVIELGRKLGFHVTVIDDRPLFADNARRANADNVICDSFEHAMNSIEGSTDTYFVIVTRGHRYDIECLRMAVNKPHAYVGMMGSRRRVHLVKEQLKAEGISEEILDKVHTPIGLDITAETPEEIAVSIIAEIIKEKNNDRRSIIYSKEIIPYITGADKSHGSAVLCTIVYKRGSAPRESGTKMVILEDGTTVGTIGGGCAESDVIQKGLYMLRAEQGETLTKSETSLVQQRRTELITVNMTTDEAEEAGMVCGGTIMVFMEKI